MTIADPQFAPAAGLRLLENEVQLWRIELEPIAHAESRWRQILSADESARADRFHFERDRENFTATRALLRILLGKYLGCAPETVPFAYGDREKPVLHASHSGAVPVDVPEHGLDHVREHAETLVQRGRQRTPEVV